MMHARRAALAALVLSATGATGTAAQTARQGAAPAEPQARTFSRADSLRGGNGPGRSWWDVRYYDLRVKIEPREMPISAANGPGLKSEPAQA